MKLTYTVSRDKESGLWYAHMVGFPYIPCMIDGRATFCHDDVSAVQRLYGFAPKTGNGRR